MKTADYILSSALPFDLPSLDPDADRLFAAVPAKLMTALAIAEGHENTVLAGDAVADWISANWRNVLPEIAARLNL